MWFSHPEALWLLLCCPFVVLFAALGRRRCAALLGQLGEPGLLQLTGSRTPKLQRPWVQVLLLLLPIFSIIIALAEPRVSSGIPKVSANSLDTVMVLDVSLSMAAEDVNGRSRLAAAREMVRSLLPELHNNRVGFITFAGTSFRQAELTQDLDALDFIVQHWINVGSAGTAGSSLEQAINAGLDLFSDDVERKRLMLLFSDGGDGTEDLQPILTRAASQGVVIHTFGLGSMQPSRIPQYDTQGAFTGYAEVDGSVATTQLNAPPLKRIAKTTGGSYLHVQRRGGWRHLLAQHLATGDLVSRDETPIFQLFLLFGILTFGAHVLITRL